ncbi:MAG TPA: 1-acyl-sn-glycerol-3-phosphate acyltransferase [Anaeromyxobacteraceae bacterium]|nr:1-acyl-sn-glycerol-3-phosphate acyltransferase [Anaeromyxobacteraceae bacterium]
MAKLLRAAIRAGYFSFDVEGAEHLPRQGPVVYAMNHAGWFALDTFFLSLAVTEALGAERVPYFAAHDAALAAPLLGPLLSGLGALPASWLRHPERLPAEISSLGICPEGVRGNCKPVWQAYRMRPWSRGFVRAAAARGALVVPAAVLGGEECLPVAWTVKLLEPLIGSIVGLPLALLPLPARWKVVFHPAVPVSAACAGASASAALAAQIQRTVQETLDREARPLGRLAAALAAARGERLAPGPAELRDRAEREPPARRDRRHHGA